MFHWKQLFFFRKAAFSYQNHLNHQKNTYAHQQTIQNPRKFVVLVKETMKILGRTKKTKKLYSWTGLTTSRPAQRAPSWTGGRCEPQYVSFSVYIKLFGELLFYISLFRFSLGTEKNEEELPRKFSFSQFYTKKHQSYTEKNTHCGSQRPPPLQEGARWAGRAARVFILGPVSQPWG